VHIAFLHRPVRLIVFAAEIDFELVARLDFAAFGENAASDAERARAALVRLVKRARAA